MGLMAPTKKQNPDLLGCTQARTGDEMALPGIGQQSKARCHSGQWIGEQSPDESQNKAK